MSGDRSPLAAFHGKLKAHRIDCVRSNGNGQFRLERAPKQILLAFSLRKKTLTLATDLGRA